MAKNKYQLERLLGGKKENNIFLDAVIKYKSIFSITVGISIALGIILVFSYCFFYINYIPPTLSINDSLNFIFISLGFGFTYFIFVSIHFAFIFIVFHKLLLDKHEWILYLLSLIILFCLSYFYYLKFKISLDFIISIVFYFLIISCFFYFCYKKDEFFKNKLLRYLFVFLFFLCLFFPIVRVPGFLNSFLSMTLSNLGVKKYGVSIMLSDEDSLFIRKIADEQDITLKTSCNILEKNKLIHDVDILWSIGEESLIEIVGENGKSNKKIRLTVNNKDMRVISVSNPKKCIFKEFRNIFLEGSYNIDNNEALGKITNFICDHNNIDKITVYGTSDLKPYKKKGNKKLSEDRANSIIKELSKDEYKPKSFKGLFSKAEGLANFEYSPYCKKNILDERDLSDCEGFNRGVILKLELKQDNTENEAVKNEAVKNEAVKNEVVTNDYDHYNGVPCCR